MCSMLVYVQHAVCYSFVRYITDISIPLSFYVPGKGCIFLVVVFYNAIVLV